MGVGRVEQYYYCGRLFYFFFFMFIICDCFRISSFFAFRTREMSLDHEEFHPTWHVSASVSY